MALKIGGPRSTFGGVHEGLACLWRAGRVAKGRTPQVACFHMMIADEKGLIRNLCANSTMLALAHPLEILRTVHSRRGFVTRTPRTLRTLHRGLGSRHGFSSIITVDTMTDGKP